MVASFAPLLRRRQLGLQGVVKMAGRFTCRGGAVTDGPDKTQKCENSPRKVASTGSIRYEQ
jgi:hypothetical protein